MIADHSKSVAVLFSVRTCLVDCRRMTDLDGRDEHVISQVLDAIDDALDALRDGTAHVRGERERTPLEWVSTALLFAKLCLHDNEFRALVEAGHQELIDNGVLT